MNLKDNMVKSEETWKDKKEMDTLNEEELEYTQNKKCIDLKDSIQEMSKRLEALYGLVTTVCLGLQAESVEKQAVECLECIAQCVWDIKIMADEYRTWQN